MHNGGLPSRIGRGAALAALLLAQGATAQTVTLAGRLGDKALLMVDGKTQTLAVGQTIGAIRLSRWVGEQAEIQQGNDRYLLTVGASPSRVGASPSRPNGREIVMTAGPGGHFTSTGSIDGHAVQFMVDTGATLVSLSRDEAERIGLDLRSARPAMMQTANGAVVAQLVTLGRVRVGEVELTGINAVVVQMPMPFILLGNSFLSRLQMKRENDVMRLELR